MTDAPHGSSDVRQTLLSAAIAGVVAIAVLVALSFVNVGSETVQAIVAIALGVGVAQVYEHKLS